MRTRNFWCAGLCGDEMRMRKNSKGGRHVAVERGLKPTGSGWPFRRELRELAEMSFAVHRQPSPPANRSREGAQAVRGMSPQQFLGPETQAAKSGLP